MENVLKNNIMEIVLKSPGNDFDPLSIVNGFDLIPDSPGIYVWGYKVIINGKKTFCPTIIGESKNLQHRLIEHYEMRFKDKEKQNSAFFSIKHYMTQNEINIFYDQMGDYSKLKTEKIKFKKF